MFELINFITILLIAVGWYLIAQAARDIFVTARLAATVPPKNERQTIYFYSLSCLLITRAFHIIKSRKWLRIFAPVAGVLFPVLQFLFWKLSLINGFAFLYLAVNLKLKGERFADQLSEEFFSALWLSFTITVRFAPYNINSDEMLVFLIANIQFYLGFLFYGFVCFYLLTLWRKSKRLQPNLYRLKDELKKPYSPFLLSTKLYESYGSNELLLILQGWERWSEAVKNDLAACPTLIYSRSRADGWSWLSSLNIILDAAAAIIVTSDGAVERQARRTFAAARHSLVEIATHLCKLPQDAEPLYSYQDFSPDYDEDDVLSAEIIFDGNKSCLTTKEIQMLVVWQFTYQSSLRTLSEYLDIEISSRKDDGCGC